MPFEVGKSFNSGAEWLCGAPLVYGTLRNPVATALLITALALIIVYVVYREDLRGTGWRLGAKSAVWLTFGVSALVFVHYHALGRSLSQGNASQGVRDVVNSIHHSVSAEGGYSVLGGGHSVLGGGYSVLGGSPHQPHPRPPPPPCPLPPPPPSPQSEAVGGAPRPDNIAAFDELRLERVILATNQGA